MLHGIALTAMVVFFLRPPAPALTSEGIGPRAAGLPEHAEALVQERSLLGTWEWSEKDSRTTLCATRNHLQWTITYRASKNRTMIAAEYAPTGAHRIVGTITRITHLSDNGYNLEMQVQIPFRADLLPSGDCLMLDEFRAEEGFSNDVVQGCYRKVEAASRRIFIDTEKGE